MRPMIEGMATTAGRGRALGGPWKAAAALAVLGALLVLAQIERAEDPPVSAPDTRSEDRRAGGEVREWEDWHGNWFVTPRGGGPAR